MEAVVFDMDGVIFDTEKLILKSWENVGNQFHIRNTKETCQKCFGTTNDVSREIFKVEYGQDFPYDEYKEHVRKLFNQYLKENGMPLKEGVKEILQYLKENGYKIGLASSTRTQIVKEELEMAGIKQWFDIVLGGDLLKNSKPEPDIYLKACENLGIEAKNAYAIEDSYNGIRSAFRAGMKPIMVVDLLPPTEEMSEKTVAIKKNLFEVINLLENSKKAKQIVQK